MTGRWIQPADIRGVTVNANETLVPINRLQFSGEVESQTGFVVTFRARRNRHIRGQPAQRRRFRDVDMTRCALRHVLFTLMPKLHRNSLNAGNSRMGISAFVATSTIRAYWRLRLPMTVEAGRVICGNGFECRGVGRERINPATGRCGWNSCALGMTDCAVVVEFAR